jgi:hypothetical protein
MKRLTAMLPVLILLLSLAACKGAGNVSILEVTNSVNVDRGEEEIAARKGMRLQHLDTVRTDSASSAWLSLGDAKAVELSELTALQVDQQARGFVLTLAYGEIKNQIDQPLADDEDFTVHTGSLVLAVRGTVFTVNYTENIVNVGVESGTVAVLDTQGNEIEVLGAGESSEYDATTGVRLSPSGTYPAFPDVTQAHYVIYKEGFRSDRIEVAFFDVEDPNREHHVVWSRSIRLGDNSQYLHDAKYYLEDDSWTLFEEGFVQISSYGADIMASSLDVYDGDGNLLLRGSPRP